MTSTTPITVRVLGRVCVGSNIDDSADLTPSTRNLLGILVAAGPSGASLDRIADAMWGERLPKTWHASLRMTVARLREAILEDSQSGAEIMTGPRSYRLEPLGLVDAWEVLGLADRTSKLTEMEVQQSLDGDPFPSVDVIDMVPDYTRALEVARARIVERFCQQEFRDLEAATCTALLRLLREQPLNEGLATTIVRCLASHGFAAEAQAEARAFCEYFYAEMGYRPQALDDFASTPQIVSTVPIVSASPTRQLRFPMRLQRLLNSELVGREDEMNLLESADMAYISGRSGTGKSRLLAELGSRWQAQGMGGVVVEAISPLDAPFAPLCVSMPDVLRLVDAELPGTDAEDRAGRLRALELKVWRQVNEHLGGSANATFLLVDDAQNLDTRSRQVLRLLIRSVDQAPIKMVISATDGEDNPEWRAFQSELIEAGALEVALVGLEIDDLATIARAAHPTATAQACLSLAESTLRLSQGLPAIARRVILNADPMTMTIPSQLDVQGTWASLFPNLDEGAAEVASVGAVLGMEFALDHLVGLAGLHEEDAIDASERLWKAGVLEEANGPERLRFEHLLIRSAFLDRLPAFKIRRLHRLASTIVDDVHEVATHKAAAVPLLSLDSAVSALRRSAELLVGQSSWDAASRQFRLIEALSSGALDAGALTMWAGALDRAGADGSSARKRSFAMAAELGDWDAALDAAISGLPEAERSDGDLHRVELLEEISNNLLPAGHRFNHHWHMSRQQALYGDPVGSQAGARAALALASDPDEIGLAHAALWTASRSSPKTLTIPDSVILNASTGIRLRLLQMQALGIAQTGTAVLADEAFNLFKQAAADYGDPLRIWQSMVFESTRSVDRGKLALAEAQANGAVEYAKLHSLAQGVTAWAGQLFHLYWVKQSCGDLWPVLKSYTGNMAESSLGTAALLVCELEATESDLTGHVEALMRNVLDRPRSFTSVALGMLAPYTAGQSPELLDRAARYLEAVESRSVIVGYGVASMGPVARYRAGYEVDLAARRDRLRVAVQISDERDLLLWRVLNRLELIRISDDSSCTDEVHGLAEGTDLEEVVAALL